MTLAPPYQRPPITEAVIAITFDEPTSAEGLADVQTKFSQHYPNVQPIANLNVRVDIEVGPDMRQHARTAVDEQPGYRRTTADLTEIVVIIPPGFIVSQLAPYPNWEAFVERFTRDWKLWKRHMHHRQIKQIGVRYINRLDIPASGADFVPIEEYLNVSPRLPEMLGPLAAFGAQARVDLPDIGCSLALNSGAVPSPMLDTASFLIDLDITTNGTPPQSDDDILALLERIRIAKNAIFEACITDRARALFNDDH